MPLPPAYNYSPQLQPTAWWGHAQQQIPGLPALPQSGSALATSYDQYAPYQSALSNLYQQSMAAPNVGQMTQEGAEPSPIPTEVGGSALAELLASTAGVSRSSTTPLTGTPGQIGETMYSYNGHPGVMPNQSGQSMVGGWATGSGFGSDTGTGSGPTGGTAPPATPPAEGGGTGATTQGYGGGDGVAPRPKEQTETFWDAASGQYVTLTYNPATGQWQ